MNRPKILGTAAESAVEQWLRYNGHPHAERRSLKGSVDKGDITGVPGICIEVKVAGRRGLLLGPWLKETERERVNAGAKYGILVAKPTGLGPKRTGMWLVAMYFGAWKDLATQAGYVNPGWDLMVQNAVSGTKVSQLPAILRSSQPPGRFLVRAVKTGDDHDRWYVATTLGSINQFLLAAGYGTTPER